MHHQWVHDYNAEEHWAHRTREDGRRSPEDVLGKLVLLRYDRNELHQIFYTTRFMRRVDQHGYVHFRQWRIYGEYGIARQRAVVWLYGETLTVVFNDTPLAQYRVTYQPDLVHLRTVQEPHLFDTIYRSAPRVLWHLDG